MPRKKMTEEEKAQAKIKREAKKKEKIKLENEARKQGLLNQKLKDLRDYPATSPRYTFKVGDSVLPKSARWEDLKVLEVLDQGKIYLIEYTSTNNNYGNPIKYQEKNYVSWMDLIDPHEEKASSNFNQRGNTLDISFHNHCLSDLSSKYYKFGVEMNPDYHRDLLWSEEDKISLIDSIFKGVEIGKFAFISLPWKENSPSYEILDGKQRMNALIDFYEDKFKYKGFYFSQLTTPDRYYFLDYNITVGKTNEQITQDQKYQYFLRLNTTGKPQDKSHLEKVEELLTKSAPKVKQK